MKKIFLIFLTSIILINNFYSQDLKRVDSIVLSYPKSYRTAKELAKHISNDFKTDIEKVRAVYAWISQNITYDTKEYGKYKDTYSFDRYRDIKRNIYFNKLSKRVLSKGKAVCEGYSILFLKTCNFLNIKTIYVNGLGKQRFEEIGDTFDTSLHSWNIVEIENEKFLIDVTWAKGSLTRDKFRYEYNFLTPPELFIKNRYPRNYEYSLLKNKISKRYFIYSPLFYMNKSINNTKLISPLIGILEKSKNQKQKFIFESSDLIYSIHYSSGNRVYEIKNYQQNENQIEFEFDFTNKDIEKFTILFNYKPVLTFKII